MNSIGRRIVLYSVEAYLDDIDHNTTYQYGSMLELRSGIRTYMSTHKFTPEEYIEVNKLAEEPTMITMSKMEIDRTIFAIELMYLYVDNIPKNKRAHVGMSDNRLKKLKSTMTIDMLHLKQKKPESHSRVKDIIVDSRLSAKKYYSFIEEQMKGE